MKLGTRLYGADPEQLLQTAQLAEALGYESLWRGEHLILPASFAGERYPYTPDGVPPIDPAAPVLDTFGVFAYVAAATTSIRLATGVYILPLRHAIITARAATTLDVLSRGRLILGVGAGWLRSEFEAVGEQYGERLRRTEETVEALRALWTQVEPRYSGRHVFFDGVRFEPKPVQQPHPPIVMGGETNAALRRAAALADGWYGHKRHPSDAARLVRRLKALRHEQGRAGPFEVTLRIDPGVGTDELRRYEEAGVDRVVLEVGSFSVHSLDVAGALERFAGDVMDRL